MNLEVLRKCVDHLTGPYASNYILTLALTKQFDDSPNHAFSLNASAPRQIHDAEDYVNCHFSRLTRRAMTRVGRDAA